ncbi:acyltransferase family protein [Ideonella alba]|uniref:Acyltransferase family protein n=1 Tax=Ideonella alba TaxID=2824118 RepID=A0A941BFG8_9BURK|nr:acyltransferase family protein [Ideonella alba]MBQ0929403.1 acyltransferase family protein [Ideonella alba]
MSQALPARRQDIEAVRVLAAFGIVWFHAHAPQLALGYAGLVVFLVLSVWLSAGSRQGWAAVRQRARRLLVPWVLWFVVYGWYVHTLHLPVVDTRHGLLAGVLAGSNIHLWYLPFMFGLLLVVDALRRVLPARGLALAAGLLATALALGIPLWRPLTLGTFYPLRQWADAALPVSYGLMLLGVGALTPRQRAAALAGPVLAAALVAPLESFGLTCAIGLGVCAWLAWRPAPAPGGWSVQGLSDLCMGIYLVHILVLEALLLRTPLRGALLAVAVFVVSALLVAGGRALAPRWRGWWS